MSSEQTLSTADLRATAQDYKRVEDDKQKWKLGPKYVRGRGDGHPRPMRVGESYATHRRWERHAAVKLDGTGKAKLARKQDMLSAGQDYSTSDDSNASAEEDVEAEGTAPDAQVMYSFDAARAPSQGSQILNAALAKAVDKFEDAQTTNLVKTEYEILDVHADEDENPGLARVQAMGKHRKAVDAEYEDYEFL
ncbi:hypothetical protein BDV97DRAFT_397254 [Delphinella strobiligena]|nr:hypothetical protein BDV97DRAFT_397254 [Delphinella strobiligena]